MNEKATIHMKMAVSWAVVPCTDVSEVLTAFIITGMTKEAICTSETSVNFYHATRRNIPNDRHPNIISFILILFWKTWTTKKVCVVILLQFFKS
jgi:hypothetical protein